MTGEHTTTEERTEMLKEQSVVIHDRKGVEIRYSHIEGHGNTATIELSTGTAMTKEVPLHWDDAIDAGKRIVENRSDSQLNKYADGRAERLRKFFGIEEEDG